MLVLSRNKNQKVCFPELGISVEILDVKGSKVRVGVDAPMEVRILRDELQKGETSQPAPKPHVIRLPQTLRHELRNALHELSLRLHVYQKRAEIDRKAGSGAEQRAQFEPDEMFEAIVRRLEGLSSHQVFSSEGLLAGIGKAPDQPGVALVVDDDDNERELLAGFLRMCGYRVAAAGDGVEAIQYLEDNEPPRVILLDMQMPRCDGESFLRQLRENPRFDETNVFVISGTTPEESGMTPEDGYTQWFGKPLDPRRVVEALSKIEAASACVA
ncbi:MAG: response regulator [Planctomycetota bacterium]